jgi:hypothetical protein
VCNVPSVSSYFEPPAAEKNGHRFPAATRGLSAYLVPGKVGKKKLVPHVDFADIGAKKSEITAPFQRPSSKNITVSVRDSYGDGVPDQIVLTARKGKKTVTAFFPG